VKEENSLIRVIRKDGCWGSVEDHNLDDFIGSGIVTAFFCPLSNDGSTSVMDFAGSAV